MAEQINPYLAGLDLVKKHSGTSGQTALAKCILSIYNPVHSFSIGEILPPLDSHYTNVVLSMVIEYSNHGETDELRTAGEWVYQNFPGLTELSAAMSIAKDNVRREWDRQREDEYRRKRPDEDR